MRTIKKEDHNNQVVYLQRLLQKAGQVLVPDGVFGRLTEIAVKQYQDNHGLIADGIVGANTWRSLIENQHNFSLGCRDFILESDEWIREYVPKDTIYLHHTAGRHDPEKTISWWEIDTGKSGSKPHRVGTSFVIGGIAHDGSDHSWNGVTSRAFNEIYWAYHLGVNSISLNKKSIGIELCSLGGLKKVGDTYCSIEYDGQFQVAPEFVCTLPEPWRGTRYYHKYSQAQISECERLILMLWYLFDIPLPSTHIDHSWFQIDEGALAGNAGIWSHCHVRADKVDCFPQPELIVMLNGLQEKSSHFSPSLDTLEMLTLPPKTTKSTMYDIKDIQDYASDLSDLVEDEG